MPFMTHFLKYVLGNIIRFLVALPVVGIIMCSEEHLYTFCCVIVLNHLVSLADIFRAVISAFETFFVV